MVGGRGGDIGIEEKPTLLLLDKPLICHVIDALELAEHVDDIVIALSPLSLKTKERIEEIYGERIKVIVTPGTNYVTDMVHAVKQSNILDPVLIVMYDLAMITPDIIEFVIEEYNKCEKPSMSVHVPLSIFKDVESKPETVFNRNGRFISPAGINVMDGKDIDREQEDCNLIIDRKELAYNLNTVYDLDVCERIMATRRG